MDDPVIVGVALLILIGLLLAGVSVAISLATSGIIGLVLLEGLGIASSVIAGTSYSAVARSSLIVVPMFVLMGMLTLYSGIAEQLFGIASKLLKKIPGSLGMATVFASAGFGAISGSSLATVATLGRTCITEMMRHGYLRSFAAAAVAASGTLAVLIPPSIILVLYGVITGESIGALLIAGIVPGILSALVLAGVFSFRAWTKPSLVSQDNREQLALAFSTGAEVRAGSPGPGEGASDGAAEVALSTEPVDSGRGIRLTFWSVTRAVLGVIVLFTIVIGGIYTGIFTPSESAAIGAFAAFILICAQYLTRPKELRDNLVTALRETASLNSMIFLILVGAGIFSFFLVTAGVPTAISRFVVGLEIPPSLTVIMLLIVLVPAGMFLDSISLLVITVPLVYEPITSLGFDGIWLGILVVKLIELGMITPPVGMNAYVTAGTTNGLEVEEVFRGLIPFYIGDVLLVAAIFLVPDIVTWLPSLSAA
jgi:TRAP-type C4-dicarboxylate transport system permease large subunit